MTKAKSAEMIEFLKSLSSQDIGKLKHVLQTVSEEDMAERTKIDVNVRGNARVCVECRISCLVEGKKLYLKKRYLNYGHALSVSADVAHSGSINEDLWAEVPENLANMSE